MAAKSTYVYKARDTSGEIVSGSVIAVSPEAVGAKLRAEGKFVVSVESDSLPGETKVDADQIRRGELSRRVSREDVIAFCQQVSVMLETGVPLSEAMESFTSQTTKSEFRTVLNSVNDSVHNGEPLSLALSRWPRVFPTLMVSLMKAAEASGTMGSMLSMVGVYLAKERRTARQMKGALSYPIFMMAAGLVMTVFLMAFVLPRFAKIYEMRSATLPAPTEMLLGISRFVTTQYAVYGPITLGVIGVLYFWARSMGGRRTLDLLRLRLPLIGPMYLQLYITRSARTMGTLLAAGVNLLDVIRVCRGVTSNVRFEKLWDLIEENVRGGRQMSDAMRDCPYVPASMASMVTAGERSGRLASVLSRIAEFSEEELDNRIKQVTAFIEPVMIMLMGVVVGTVAVALLLPIFSMGNVMSGGG